MLIKRLSLPIFLEITLFVTIVFFAIRPVENFDFWFHVKYGEYILQTTQLPFTDQFSHTAFGQPAIPYEWLFQVMLYLIYSTFSKIGIQALVVSLVLGYVFIFRQILKEIFQISLIPRMFLVAASFVLGYDFWVERPQSAAYVIFMAVLYLILKRVYLGKNWLWITIPLFFIWTNLHASMILGLYLFFSFALVALIRRDFKLTKNLFLFGIINTLITLLPPLGIKVYQLLYLFFEKRDFITLVIDEWVPLYKLSTRFYIYLSIMVAAGISLTLSFIKQRKQDLLLFLPFIPLGLFVISGVRQTQFSLPAIFLLYLPAFKMINMNLNNTIRFGLSLTLIVNLVIFSYFYRQEATEILRLYPVQALSFIKENLSGNMFNEYHMGGYLMYRLSPQFKTFIDGRTDMFLPIVLPEYDELLNDSYADAQLLNKFNRLVDKYRISWAIISVERLTPVRRLARILRNEPDWHLVYFDDTAEIYVRDDRVNDRTIKQFGFQSATPFSPSLYKKDQQQQARDEYLRMQTITKSAVVANALGVILLENEKYDEAKKLFEEALTIDKKTAAPKMNLAELAAKDGNLQEAIKLYKQAIKDEPIRGLAYLRLGQLILASGGSKEESKKLWKKGLLATPDQEILTQLQKALNN